MSPSLHIYFTCTATDAFDDNDMYEDEDFGEYDDDDDDHDDGYIE